MRSLRHCFEFLIRFRGDQMLESHDQLRFCQSKAVQRLDKRHEDNFVRSPAFANANQDFDAENRASAFALVSGTKKRRPVFRTPR
jgi:hypothetical protein